MAIHEVPRTMIIDLTSTSDVGRIVVWRENPNQIDKNSGFLRYYPVGVSDAITRPSLSILATILKPQYFNELRTNQNLGYVVTVTSEKISGMNFLVLKIQSSSAEPSLLQ